MTLPKPARHIVIDEDMSIHMGIWCPKLNGILMDCDRSCDTCEWQVQQVLQ